jgi:hypothetical protein
MIPSNMFSSPMFVGLNAFTFLIYAAFGALFVLLPFVLITAGGYSAAAAGSALLPLPIVAGLASGYAAKLSFLYGARATLSSGAAICAVGYTLLMKRSTRQLLAAGISGHDGRGIWDDSRRCATDYGGNVLGRTQLHGDGGWIQQRDFEGWFIDRDRGGRHGDERRRRQHVSFFSWCQPGWRGSLCIVRHARDRRDSSRKPALRFINSSSTSHPRQREAESGRPRLPGSTTDSFQSRQLRAYARLSRGAPTARGPTRQHPICPGKMTGIAAWIALEIILMFGLRLPKFARWRHFRHHLARP